MMNKYVSKIKKLRTKSEFTISVAESCTGGMLSAELTRQSGSSKYFDGSIISYSNYLKIKLLNVPKKTIDKYGAVSHQTALAMIKGLASKSNSNILISITGVAGPKGGTIKTPIGCVFFGVGIKSKNKGKFFTIKKIFKGGTRRQIQKKSTEFALKKIIQLIKNF